MAERSVEVDEGTIRYWVHGEGEPIFLIPGFSTGSDTWIRYGYPEALPGYRLLMADPLGHGESTKSHNSADYFSGRTIAQMTAVLDAESVDAVPMVGFSRGGMIAAMLRDRAPDRVSAAVLVGTPLGRALQTSLSLQETVRPALAAGDWDTYFSFSPTPLPPEIRARIEERNDPRALAVVIEAHSEWVEAFPDLGLIESAVPTLSVFGSGDSFADELRDSLEMHNSQYEEHDWGSHLETLVDGPGVGSAITRFLNSKAV